MGIKEMLEYRRSLVTLTSLRHHQQRRSESRALSATANDTAAPAMVHPAGLTGLTADLVAVVAGLQAEIDELRGELARERNAKLAIFGEQAMIEQLTRVERDFEGFEAIVELDEEATGMTANEAAASVEESATLADARDTRAGINILAKQVGAMNAGRSVDSSKLERAIERMKESAKRQMKIRSRGKVHIKIKKLSRGKSSDEA
jgi:hypothetical protein